MNNNSPLKSIKIDGSTWATYEQISTPQICQFCRCRVDMTVEMWVKADGKIAHDYCVRIRGLR